MTVFALAELIWKDDELRKSIDDIARKSAVMDLQNINVEAIDLEVDWFHLLRCASIFLAASDEYFHDIALRVLHGCLNFSDVQEEKSLATALLAQASSLPSIDLAIRRSLIPANTLERIPFALSLDVAAHQVASTINIDNSSEFIGNEFQTDLWKALQNYDWISASAPTSAGKSYILKKWIERAIEDTPTSSTFYIVPTRALIAQVESDLRRMLVGRIDEINISSLPFSFSSPKVHNIYIYTQERLHLYLLNQNSTFKADFIIIDEAQQIGASRRGILLQQVLEMACTRFPDAKVLFASPSTENPQHLLAFAPENKTKTAISGAKPTVNQNLIWVEQIPRKPDRWEFNLFLDGQRKRIGEVQLAARPGTMQKLPFIANAIAGKGGGNVIYANRASDAEKIAEILCQFIEEDLNDPELNALSELAEKAVHKSFILRRFVKKGVAFHYGNIPQLIRTEVERLFSSGKIKYLVCTSTLVEGVNLSCRNIFMRNPKRGMKELMNPDDFWNLAGRAGRWGMEFQGNIFCVDPLKSREWYGGGAPKSKKKHVIKIATQKLAADYVEFSKYISEDAPKLKIGDRFHEQLFSYLVFRYSQYEDLGSSLNTDNLSQNQIEELTSNIKEAIFELKVSVTTVVRNPGINPYGMTALYTYFQTKEEAELEDLLPIDPLSDAPIVQSEDGEKYGDAAVENFIAIFSRISTYLGGPLGSGQTAFGNALLVVHWMRGYPLHRIIDEQIRYWKKREPTKKNTAVIRETMERVEKVARFETPKYLHCYMDILVQVFNERGKTDLLPKVEEFWLYLEFGVSKRTQLSLMALGLSRSSVTAISDFITEDNLSEQECLNWLSSNNWLEFNMPRLVDIEISTVLQRHGRSQITQVMQ